MYRLIVESLLGLSLEKGCLRFAPCLPAHWSGFTMRYRYRETFYDIEVRQAGPGAMSPAPRVTVDGAAQADGCVRLVDDRTVHAVRVDLG
jgi:cellobiose phosphorylase